MVIILSFFIVLSIILGIALIRLYNKHIEIESLNEEIQSQNKAAEKTRDNLTQEIKEKEQKLEHLKEKYTCVDNTIQSLEQTAEKMRQSAEERAEKCYQVRMSDLELQYQKKSDGLKKQLEVVFNNVSKKVAQEEEKLSELKAKQLAYIKEQQRQLEIEAQKDFYCLEIADNDKNDIELLREMQNRFIKKEAIDKLIWEVYFKKPYDALVSRLSLDKDKKCGIYKITNLTTGQVYIGQSVKYRPMKNFS